MEVDSIPQQTQEKTAQIDSADLVVGVLADLGKDGIVALCEGLRTLPGSPRIVVLQRDPVGNARCGKLTNGPRRYIALLAALVRGWSRSSGGAYAEHIGCLPIAFRSDRKTGSSSLLLRCIRDGKRNAAMGLPIIASSARIGLRLGRALLHAPHVAGLAQHQHYLSPYAMSVRKENSQSVRAGRRRFAAAGSEDSWHESECQWRSGQTHPLASLAPVAVCDNLQICQVHVGARVYPPTDWTNMSSLMAQVLGPIFLEMDRSAACWQRARGSVSVPVRGEYQSPSQETGTLDLNRMVETFRLGVRDLQEIWSLVLPPATLFEIRKVSRSTAEQVNMPDELWARIVYDFALAHRLRTINRDHLLRSMTPLYLAWVVSYARELETAGATSVEQRIERLALAYEAAKPYLISRWRWPDRFNP